MAQTGMDPGGAERTDAELLAAVARQDRGALRMLYERHEPWIMARVARRCADRQMAEEVVQDTFVAVWRSADRYEGRGEVAAWMWGIAIHELLHRLRPRKPLLDRLRMIRSDTLASAEEQVLLGVQHGELGTAMGGLSPELGAVVQATVLDGLTTREAARLLGIPAGTVKTRMMRAKAQMREALA
ncbi:MAG TPA: RNA polymerase sigma factor [Acidimicrobiales bacterium]|nr:RNA polymerase sigma factor [Acidimicrobiales bacterium]